MATSTKLNFSALLHIPQLPTYLAQVEQGLAGALAHATPSLHKPIKRLINDQSKRLRPALVIAAAAARGVAIDKKVIAGCVAVELVHIGSLVHDDIIDNAVTRWGVSTVNGKEGVHRALLVGDYLFASANAQAATISAEVARTIAAAIAGVCNGEAQELADQYNPDRTVQAMLQAIDGKTATLIAAACQVGGLCSSLTNAHVAALAHFGHEFGMAFQLIDDVLDVVSTPQLMGKAVGNDMQEGVYTMPLLLSLQGPSGPKLKKMLADRATPAAAFAKILVADGSIAKTIAAAQAYNRSAAQALGKCGDTKTAAALCALPDVYLRWAIKNLVADAYASGVHQHA
ncbi:MAG TPA: polyprenyl synthetase family protein [Nevskiaceae bacterium]|nr:polyprenyl synthetase family protein [Nevskiaceae bacterium]